MDTTIAVAADGKPIRREHLPYEAAEAVRREFKDGTRDYRVYVWADQHEGHGIVGLGGQVGFRSEADALTYGRVLCPEEGMVGVIHRGSMIRSWSPRRERADNVRRRREEAAAQIRRSKADRREKRRAAGSWPRPRSG